MNANNFSNNHNSTENSSGQNKKSWSKPTFKGPEWIQEYSVFQFILLKFKKQLTGFSLFFKQNVSIRFFDLLRSSGFWKAIVFFIALSWTVGYVKTFKLSFHWPVKITKLNTSSTKDTPLGVLPELFSTDNAAPNDLVSIDEKKALEYIKHFAKVAIAEHKKYDIPASIKMAQAMVETGAGQSTLAKKNKNHFGIKCFSKKCAKGHCSNMTDDSHKDFFRNYDSAWESWRAHSKLISSDRYKTLFRHGDDYKAWAHGLKKLGYATDKNYDKKLIAVIEKFQLHRLDQQ